VHPKRVHEPLFAGVLYIVDEEWAIHSLNLAATKKSNIEFLDTLRIQQVYLPMSVDMWVIKQQVLYPTIKIFGFDFTGNFVTVYNNQKINQPIVDSLFKERVVSSYDQTANKVDTSYWIENRPLPLLDEEQRDYAFKDSLTRKYDDPFRRDSIRKRQNRFRPFSFLLDGYTFRAKENKFFFQTNSLTSNLANYNTVEGLNVALKLNGNFRLDSTRSLSGAIVGRYGFSNLHYNSMGRLIYFNRAKNWRGKNRNFKN